MKNAIKVLKQEIKKLEKHQVKYTDEEGFVRRLYIYNEQIVALQLSIDHLNGKI